MRVLLISNQRPNAQGIGNPIMFRMLNALKQDIRVEHAEFLAFDNSIDTFGILRHASKKFDIVHIHFGGLYALMIWIALIGTKNRKFITFHGTDIHAKSIRTANGWLKKLKIRLNQWASFMSICLFDKCGFVAEEMMGYVPRILKNQLSKKAFIHPLGVDYDLFQITNKHDALEALGLKDSKYILFSDVSNTTIKRRDIAQNIVKELGDDFELLIMSGVKPNEVPYYINASEFLLLTSDEEGSPNIIRECLALNKRVFSVEVGDTAKQLAGLNNSSIISRIPIEAANTIHSYIGSPYVDNTRETRKSIIDFQEITEDIVGKVYCE